jgi:hypothetical protein
MTILCTIADSGYLRQALISRQSFLEFNPSGRFFILMTDLENQEKEIEDIISLTEISQLYPELLHMREYYDIVEFSTAVKPFLLDYLRELMKNRITYVDPDTQFFSSILEILDPYLPKHVVISPHRLTPSDENLTKDSMFLKYGIYNLGFISIGAESQKFLKWWQSKLIYDCTRYRKSEVFTDQKWIDLAIVYFDIQVLSHIGVNVAPWNIDERVPERNEEGWYCSDGSKLVFFHFSQISQILSQGISEELLVAFRIKIKNDILFQSFQDLLNDYSNKLVSISLKEFNISPSSFRYLRSELARRICRYHAMHFEHSTIPRSFLIRVDDFIKYLEKSDLFREFMPLFIDDSKKIVSTVKGKFSKEILQNKPFRL